MNAHETTAPSADGRERGRQPATWRACARPWRNCWRRRASTAQQRAASAPSVELNARRRCRGSRFCGSFCRQRRSSVRMAAAWPAAARSRSGSFVKRSPIASETVVAVERLPARQSISKSTQPNAQMSARLIDRLAARLLRAHVGGGAEDHARAASSRRRDRRRHRPRRPCRRRVAARAPSPDRSRAP